RVAYQRTVASPWHRLGAHDRYPLLSAEVDERAEPAFERVGLHVVGVAAEAFVSPTGIGRVLARAPQPAQDGHRQIFDASLAERGAEGIGVELWVMAGAWHRPDVCEALDAVSAEQGDKPVDRQRRMTDGKDRALRPVAFLQVVTVAHVRGCRSRP